MKSDKWGKHFNTTPITIKENTFQISLSELQPLHTPSNYWHGTADPSTWLAVAVFNLVKNKFPGEHSKIYLQIAAHVLSIETKMPAAAIKWHENYMRWHDGDPDYRVLEEE